MFNKYTINLTPNTKQLSQERIQALSRMLYTSQKKKFYILIAFFITLNIPSKQTVLKQCVSNIDATL